MRLGIADVYVCSVHSYCCVKRGGVEEEKGYHGLKGGRTIIENNITMFQVMNKEKKNYHCSIDIF